MRWIQHPITNKLVPANEYVRPKEAGHYVHGDIQAFVSPVDGTVISDRKKLRDHNIRNNVVHADDMRGVKPPTTNERAETFKRKQVIWEAWNAVERGHRPNIQSEG